MKSNRVEGMEEFIGRKLKEEYREETKKTPHGRGVIITRPNHYKSEDIHINMYVIFDECFNLVSIEGDKCYSRYKGMYNRSSSVYDRDWSKKDIAYLKKFIMSITE